MENYFMHYDSVTGDILGFYLESIHGDNIPEPNIEITPEKHDFYMQNNGKYKLNIETLEDELAPIVEIPQQSSEIDQLNEQIQMMQGAIDFIIMNY